MKIYYARTFLGHLIEKTIAAELIFLRDSTDLEDSPWRERGSCGALKARKIKTNLN